MLKLHKLTALIVLCCLLWLVWFQNACEQHYCVCGRELQCVCTEDIGVVSLRHNSPCEVQQGAGAQNRSVFLLGPPIKRRAGWGADGVRLFIQWDQLHQHLPPLLLGKPLT